MRVFENGHFVSCDNEGSVFTTLVEDRGKILYRGDELPPQYQKGERVNLGGKCAVPAFADTHIHFEGFAFFNAGLDCRGVSDFDELFAKIKKYNDNNKNEKIIIGFGISANTVKEKRLPTREELDGITEKPVFLVKYDGHAAVANTAMLKKFPPGVGEAEGYREETGGLFQNAFYEASDYIIGTVSPVRVLRNLAAASDYMARRGISFIHTTEGIGFPLDLDFDLMRFAARGLVQDFRVYFQTMELKKVFRRKLTRVGGCFACALDGCFGSVDAALREPYSDDPENRGVLFYSQEVVTSFVKEANRAGIQVSLHAIGDAAVDQALTAFEAALQDFPREDHRHIIIHADLMEEADIRRAAAMNIHIALQPPFLHWKEEPMEYIEKILGRRGDGLIPLKSMLDAGLIMAGGSDASCTMPDPIFSIWCACNHPNQRESVSVMDALKMHTINAAALSFDEKERGSLEVGKVADFTVLDQNILEVPVAEIKNITVDALYLKGEKYRSRSIGAATLLLKSLFGSN